MTGKGHNIHRLIFRIALIVTYLCLFATQLSYKFYCCASVPYYSSGRALQVIGTLIPGPRDIHVLSLDKRYSGKHLFPHPGPIVRVNPPLPAPREYAETRPVEIFHIFHCTPTQRGPPSTV